MRFPVITHPANMKSGNFLIAALLVFSAKSAWAWPTNQFRAIDRVTNSKLQDVLIFAQSIPSVYKVQAYSLTEKRSVASNGGEAVRNVQILSDGVLRWLKQEFQSKELNLGDGPFSSSEEGLQHALYYFDLHASPSDEDAFKVHTELAERIRKALESSRVQLFGGEATAEQFIFGILGFYDEANAEFLFIAQKSVYFSPYSPSN